MRKIYSAPTTDADMMRLARRMQRLTEELHDILGAIQESEHQHAQRVVDEIEANSLVPYAWATDVVAGAIGRDELSRSARYAKAAVRDARNVMED